MKLTVPTLSALGCLASVVAVVVALFAFAAWDLARWKAGGRELERKTELAGEIEKIEALQRQRDALRKGSK